MKARGLMRHGLLVAGLALLVFAAGVAIPLDEYAGVPVAGGPLVIDDIAIVDLAAGVVRPGQTIVIAAHRIVYAGAGASAPVPAGARRIAGTGKYAMPGLWDMHIHTVGLSPQLHFPLLIANGVTSVRDMGDGCSFGGDLDCVPTAAAWHKRAAAGTLLAPRIVSTASYHVETVEAGMVQALKARGDTMLKLQLDADVSPDAFGALLSEARQHGMQAAGHLPYQVDLLDPRLDPLLDHFRSIEHDASLLPHCSRPDALFDGRNRNKRLALERANPARCAAVLALMARRGIAYVPSHIASNGQDWLLLSGDYQRDARVKYVALPQRLLWRAYAAIAVAGVRDEDRAVVEAWYRASLALTARAHASGVPVMAGSDSIDAYVTHGFGLHDELAQMVGAGLSPLDALRAATLVPARHAGREGDLGSIEAGKLADIVLLQKNPLDDIAHAGRIDSVVYDGKLYQRKELDGMLAFVERQAASFSVNCKFLWAMRPW